MQTQTVLITGALAGIGRATALAFARTGARLVVSGRQAAAGAALLAELEALGAEAEFLTVDVRREGEVAGMIDRAVERFGRLDAAVNNAGTEGPRLPITEHTTASWAETFDTNVVGTMLCMKHQLRVMLEQGSGSIVNLSSIFGLVGAPGDTAYAASKHAIEGLTKSAALEVAASGVRVNAVSPGPIGTAMIERVARDPTGRSEIMARVPAGRFGHVDEVAATILFLASDQAPFITGQSIGIDGGLHAA